MKKLLTTIFGFLTILTFNAQDLSKLITKDAVMVAKINGTALNNKMSMEYLQELDIMDEFMRELRSNPNVTELDDLGFDFSRNAYSFAEVSDSLSVMYVLMPLKNKSNLEKNFLQDKGGYIEGSNYIMENDMVMTWNDERFIIAFGEVNQMFMRDSLFRVKYNITADPYDYSYDYDTNYDYYSYDQVEEATPVYTEDGNYYYPETEYAEEAVEEAVDAVQEAAGDAIDATEEYEVVEEYAIVEEVEAPAETYWENGVEYYLNGEQVESVVEETEMEYTEDEYSNYNSGYNDNYYSRYDRYYNVADSLTTSWLWANINDIQSNKSRTGALTNDVKNVINSSSDASVFVDYGRVMNLYFDYLYGSSMSYYNPMSSFSNLMNLYNGIKVQADLTFAEDEMNLDIHSIMDDKNADLFGGMMDHKFNKKFLNHMDLENALAYYSVSFDTEKVLEMYPRIISQYMGVVPDMEDAGPAIAEFIEVFIDEEAVAELFPGNATVICDGFTNQKMSYTTYDYDENFNAIETIHENEELLPSVLLMIESENSSPIRKLIALAEKFETVEQTKYGFIVKPSSDLPVSTYVIFQDDIIFMCNDEARMQNIVNGKSTGKKSKTHANKLKKNNMVAYVDAQKIMDNVPYSPQRERELKSWELAKSSLADMEIIQYQKSKNVIVTSMNVSTPSAVNNSWQYFWDTLNQFYKIETGK